VDYYYIPRQLHHRIAVDDLNLYILYDLTLKKEWTIMNSFTTVLYLNLDSTIKEETIYLDIYYIQDMLCYHLSSSSGS
ncbi:MAG: hypothetical protein ACI8RD_006009, partial [Bacillariaceae sp.]|jgi:hypothetical protein